MEVVVHGTKQGYKSSFIPNLQPSFALGDIRNGVNDENPLGKSAYSLALVNGGCVFTKYTIIRDTLRAYATGNLAFSLFLPANKELTGKATDVKSLLDKLSRYYIDNYVKDNNVNRGETALIQEDWSFVNDILSKFTEQEKSSKDEEITSGTADPAFHYYKSDIELIEHLDKPFQEEYRNYRQILFIDSNLQGIYNPLNVLKNSGGEVNPDLKNEYYYLNNYNSTKGVKISANGKLRSEGKGNNHIRAKWQVEINYSKDFHKPIVVTGSISNPDSDIHKYLEINGNEIIIKYDAFQPEPETKTISFNVITNKAGTKVKDAEIQVDNQPWQCISNVTFTAEELGREHKIIARRGDNLFSDVVKITPKDYSAASITLPLIEKRVVKIMVTDQESNRDVFQFKVYITSKNFYKEIDTDQIEFVGDEIDKEWNIRVEKPKEFVDSEIKKFCPAKDGNSINFKLKKAKEQAIGLSNNEPSNHNLPGKEKKQKFIFGEIIPKNWGKIGFGVLILVLGIWIYFFRRDNQPKETPLRKWQIEMYVTGDSLALDKLIAYKENWKKQEKDFITKSGGGIFGGDENVDSTKWKNVWNPAFESIEQAIRKRILINDNNFVELINLDYDPYQQLYKNAIGKIDSTKYAEVGEGLGDVSDFTLTQIAKKINEVLNPKEPVEKETPQELKREANKPEHKKETPKKNDQQKEQSNAQEHKTAAPDINTEIITYIRGGELKKEILEQYQKDTKKMRTLNASIDLCLKLWSLNGTTNNSYSSYQKELNNDASLKNSKLKDFVDEMCRKDRPKYINELPKSDQKKPLSEMKINLQ